MGHKYVIVDFDVHYKYKKSKNKRDEQLKTTDMVNTEYEIIDILSKEKRIDKGNDNKLYWKITAFVKVE